MNATDIKIGKKSKVCMLTQEHENTKIGDEVLIVGAPIVLCKLASGKLERFYCHELEETEDYGKKQ